MPGIELSLNLTGPYCLLPDKEHGIINEVDPRLGGIYLWTVPVNGSYYPHYIGHTHCFVERLVRHLINLRSGKEWYYDTAELQNGRFGKGWGPGSQEPFDQSMADAYVGLLRFYLASDSRFEDKRLRERIELALALHFDQTIYRQAGVPQVWDWKCSSYHSGNAARPDEPEVIFRMTAPEGLAMIPSEPLRA